MKTFIHSYETTGRDVSIRSNIHGIMAFSVTDDTHEIVVYLNAVDVEAIHMKTGEWLRQLAQQLAEKNKATV